METQSYKTTLQEINHTITAFHVLLESIKTLPTSQRKQLEITYRTRLETLYPETHTWLEQKEQKEKGTENG